MSAVIEQLDLTSTDYHTTLSLLEQQLLSSLQADLAQSENRAFVLIAKSVQGDIIGGLAGSTSYDWLLIKILWVQQSNRGTGLGKRLLNEAERIGLNHGCHSAWLDTSNPVAESFYKNNGYQEFGRLENDQGNTPPTHKRWFLKKVL